MTFERTKASPTLMPRSVAGQVTPTVPTHCCGRMSPLGCVQPPPGRVMAPVAVTDGAPPPSDGGLPESV